MTTRFRLAAFLPFLFVLPITANAQELAADSDEELRRYSVEVIVFTYLQDVSTGTEIFLPDPPPEAPEVASSGVSLPFGLFGQSVEPDDDPVTPEAIPQQPESSEPVAITGMDPLVGDYPDEFAGPTEPEFLLIPQEELSMLEIADKLDELSVYQTMLHAGWIQETTPLEDSITMNLDMLIEPPEKLTGSFTLYLSRFLHLIVDLTLDSANSLNAPVAVDTPNPYSYGRLDYAQKDGNLYYRLNDDRIFKSGETRYFDHPKFGVIARVTRIEEEEPEVEEESGILAE